MADEVKKRHRRKERIVTFRVTPEQNRVLRLLARSEGVTTSEVIRQAVQEKADAVTGGA